MKVCRDCREEKPLAEFYHGKRCRDGHRPECKACMLAARRDHRNANLSHYRSVARKRYHADPEKSRAERKALYHKDREWGALRAQLNNYGLTLDQYHAMQERQDFSCAICGDVTELHIDHCHAAGHVRGLLCAGCNLGIGHFRERPEALASAVGYLAART